MLNKWFTSVLLIVSFIAHEGFCHSVWIEPLDGKLVVRFGEPDGSYEKSPGYLDSLAAPSAFILDTNAPIVASIQKSTNHFLINNSLPTCIAGVETSFTVRAKRKPFFYARWQIGAGAAAPLLTFDLVPTGKAGEVRVYFRGKPLGGVKATLRMPDEREQELTADADGFLRFTTDMSGLYLLSVAHHRENMSGFHFGQPYEQYSHNTALSWLQP